MEMESQWVKVWVKVNVIHDWFNQINNYIDLPFEM